MTQPPGAMSQPADAWPWWTTPLDIAIEPQWERGRWELRKDDQVVASGTTGGPVSILDRLDHAARSLPEGSTCILYCAPDVYGTLQQEALDLPPGGAQPRCETKVRVDHRMLAGWWRLVHEGRVVDWEPRSASTNVPIGTLVEGPS